MTLLSPRHEPYTLASIAIQSAVLDAVAQYELSEAELVHILASITQAWAKGWVKNERETEE